MRVAALAAATAVTALVEKRRSWRSGEMATGTAVLGGCEKAVPTCGSNYLEVSRFPKMGTPKNGWFIIVYDS